MPAPQPRAAALLLLPPLLLLLSAAAPSTAAPTNGSCVVDLIVLNGTFVGLSGTQLTYRTTYINPRGRTARLSVRVRADSKDDSQRGEAAGKLPLVLSGGACNFSDSALSRRDPGYQSLLQALRGFEIGGVGAEQPGSRINVGGFSGGASVVKRLSTTTSFNVSDFAIDLKISGNLRPGGSKSFKPLVTFPAGDISITTNFSRATSSGVVAEGTFGVNSTAISALSPVKRTSSCKLSLRARGGPAKFTLICASWAATLARVTPQEGATAAVAFKQARGRGAVALQASGLLSSAYVYGAG